MPVCIMSPVKMMAMYLADSNKDKDKLIEDIKNLPRQLKEVNLEIKGDTSDINFE